jgi:hypothetical protein
MDEVSGEGVEASDVNERRTRCEVWTRVMGYHRPVSHFNIGKKAEHYSRQHFKECVADNSRFVKQYPVAVAQ